MGGGINGQMKEKGKEKEKERERERERAREGGREGEREREREGGGGRERKRERERDVPCAKRLPEEPPNLTCYALLCAQAHRGGSRGAARGPAGSPARTRAKRPARAAACAAALAGAARCRCAQPGVQLGLARPSLGQETSCVCLCVCVQWTIKMKASLVSHARLFRARRLAKCSRVCGLPWPRW